MPIYIMISTLTDEGRKTIRSIQRGSKRSTGR